MTPEEIERSAERLTQFTASCRRLNKPDIAAAYDQRWVAAYNGEVVASARSLDALREAVDSQNLPRAECQFQFIGAHDELSPTPKWRHVTRGTLYTEIGRAELQTSIPIEEGEVLVIYQDEDGKFWARPVEEF